MKTTQEAWWIIDQLILQGVTQFCVAPGSRNSPLILAVAEHPKAETIVHFDERGLGFYGLGYGKGSKKPSCLIVTSGTAVGNLLPSIMEAYHSLTPLILLTADRPFELKNCGANQTCDQVKIFSSFLRWEMDIPPDQKEKSLRSTAAQAVFHSLARPPGPVQINCQFREPFIEKRSEIQQSKPIKFSFPRFVCNPVQVDAAKGVILLGAVNTDIEPVLNLGKRIQWPIFADVLSNGRSHLTDEQIIHFDPILKTGRALKPDFVLHFGDRFTSKKILDWPIDLHVGTSSYLQDPDRSISHRNLSDIDGFCESFQAPSDPKWIMEWKKLDLEMKKRLSLCFKNFETFTESHLMQQLSSLIPKELAVFLGNGMPIREADLFLFPPKVRNFFSNRGLSGIDGNIATAAGLIKALQSPLIAILGDQTCLHDLNSLPLLKQASHPFILIISNNFGGGIFSHLPVSQSPYFETHIAANHSWQFKEIAAMFDIPYSNSLDKLSFEFSQIIELNTSRTQNHKFHESCQLFFSTVS